MTRTRPPAPSDRLSAGRLAAVQALYQIEILDASPETVVLQFLAHRSGGALDEGEKPVKPDAGLFVAIVRGTHARSDEIDDILRTALPETWPLERLHLLLRCVLRAGVYELLANRKAPPRVVLSEYVDLADAFFAAAERGMANAVLDRLARRLRAPAFESEEALADAGTSVEG